MTTEAMYYNPQLPKAHILVQLRTSLRLLFSLQFIFCSLKKKRKEKKENDKEVMSVCM
jgi:hypothetical protein